MDLSNLKILSWNVNSLRKRATDIHAHVLTHKYDVVTLQEVGVNGSGFQLPGYQSFELPANLENNTRGLTTFFKNSIPATLCDSLIVDGTEFLVLKLYVEGYFIYIINVYIHNDRLSLDNLPSCIFDHECVLMGDLNARHRSLENFGSPNRNGRVLHSILDSLDNVRILGNKEPTHVRGGRIDYVLLFNMSEYEAAASVVGDLVSDHFALEANLGIRRITFCHKRKRLKIKDDKKSEFIFKVGEWYKEYKSINGHGNDENKFLDDFLDVLDTILQKSENNYNGSFSKKSMYFNDKIVRGWNKVLRKSQRQWSLNPGDSRSKETMIQIAQGTSEIRKEIRGKYFDKFLEEVSFLKSLGGVWNAVNKVRGVKKRIVAHPNPEGKAKELMRKWATASSLGNLPVNIQASLRDRRSHRRQLVEMQMGVMDETCVPFTRDELLLGIKKGKSTAPGVDGITYEIINCLIMMEESPLLDLINLSYRNGRLPIKWKLALIVPVPKSNGDYRPISLTSCICKLMERLILNRLLFVIGDQLSNNMYGFIKGKCTTDCVLRVLCNNNVKCRAFVDLKGAFDRANREVILEELVNKGVKGSLLRWIHSYLNERKAKVLFQGYESEEMDLELGTPQGGVLSPTLFNVLMDKIARHNFPRGAEIVIYADDIMIQCRNEFILKKALVELQSLCLDMGLVINEDKSKIQSCMISENEFLFNGRELERVNTYKYLGMYIGFSKSMDEINYVRNTCVSRLKPLQILANRGSGAGIPVLRMMYISTVRSIIDYAAPVLISYSEQELKKLEIIQNRAMRIILGCPMSTRIEIMRLELNLPSIMNRIREIVSVAAVRSIRRGEKVL